MPLRLVAFCAAFLVCFALPDLRDAEAARMGGGRSFGGSPFMSRPAPAPKQAPALNRQAQDSRGPVAGAARPAGMAGGMGGMLGGLLAGTLLGSLLFGGGFHGGGFMDILLLGLLAYFAFKLFSRFRRPVPADGPPPFGGREQSRPEGSRRSGMDWERFRGPGDGARAEGGVSVAPGSADIPPGFDAEEFLRGAKMAYTRLQSSWDKRELGDIAQFATQAVIDEITAQAAEDPHPSTTEILLINADLLSVVREGEKERAAVLFDVLLREDPKAQSGTQTREIWHFMRRGDESWKLDGIQQVE